MTIVENVDEDGRPVADGDPGARLLVTSLFNRAQPLIRFELPDAMIFESTPCACGRTLRRVRSIQGRTDDVLELPARAGGRFGVHPLQFGVVARDRDVVEFQVVQEGPRLRLFVVPRGETPSLEARLRSAVEQRLRELGVAEPAVEVVRRQSLARTPGGKLQLVVADRGGTGMSVP
jgi:phenylacetate-coenzyme A ligase PaaK-like adenylate-forming protein